MDDGVFFGCGGVDVYNMTHGFTFVFVCIGEHVCCLVVSCANVIKHQCLINIQCDDDADADADHASYRVECGIDSSKYILHRALAGFEMSWKHVYTLSVMLKDNAM